MDTEQIYRSWTRCVKRTAEAHKGISSLFRYIQYLFIHFKVTCLIICRLALSDSCFIVSGSADGAILVWRGSPDGTRWDRVAALEIHKESVTSIDVRSFRIAWLRRRT